MKKRAEILDDAVLTLARHGELGNFTETAVKEGIVTKKAFIHKAVSMVFDKTSQLTQIPVNPDHMNKLAAMVDGEFSVADSMTLSEDDFMTAVMQKTAQLAIQK
jgi:hypothetical protein